MFHNMKELKERLVKRLVALSNSNLARYEATADASRKAPAAPSTAYNNDAKRLQLSSEVAAMESSHSFLLEQRIFHAKFGYGTFSDIDGNKLTVEFEKAGQKRVVASFVQAV